MPLTDPGDPSVLVVSDPFEDVNEMAPAQYDSLVPLSLHKPLKMPIPTAADQSDTTPSDPGDTDKTILVTPSARCNLGHIESGKTCEGCARVQKPEEVDVCGDKPNRETKTGAYRIHPSASAPAHGLSPFELSS